ncbi:DUF2835 family protein [Parashewanella curva]|uniref:DUF2835 family protein n=1 Tax=Parashewanella curva TaxID=2338552 RepID=A0A3L8PZS2_9GAMM|nr:DUF2835 domain-containing protein [Parashewanella curva]RLV60038.1 DUF2835 family protein [Parashewanella curva]
MEFTFSISVSAKQYLAFYQGAATHVDVIDDTGRHLQINARYFRSFVTVSGIQGRFKLTLDSNGSFIELNRL